MKKEKYYDKISKINIFTINERSGILSPAKVDKYNDIILDLLSIYLNLNSDFITEGMMQVLMDECGLSAEEAFSILTAEACGLDIENKPDDMELYEKYFPYMFHSLNVEDYESNPYYKNIKIKDAEIGRWNLKNEIFKPYEAFVFNDLKKMNDGRIIPQIGFFTSEFKFPAVLEDNREWMLVTPNEVETMKKAIDKASGKILTYGLGLGYYAYMTSEKEDVTSVTIVEKDKNVIALFEKYILPQFNNRDKIRIINEDAFIYAENYVQKENYNFIYTDIWHDTYDGLDMYLKMKEYESLSPDSKYMYWIEDTMLCYIE